MRGRVGTRAAAIRKPGDEWRGGNRGIWQESTTNTSLRPTMRPITYCVGHPSAAFMRREAGAAAGPATVAETCCSSACECTAPDAREEPKRRR